jgi:hypothetical protein
MELCFALRVKRKGKRDLLNFVTEYGELVGDLFAIHQVDPDQGSTLSRGRTLARSILSKG